MHFTRLSFLLCLAALSVFVPSVLAQTASSEKEIVKPNGYKQLELRASTELGESIGAIIRDLINSRPAGEFKEDEIAFSLIDLTDPANLRFANFRGEEKIYPASVVKAFYMAALYQQLEDGKLVMTKELERGLRDMIVDSSNEATQYIVDVLTDTSSGGELTQKEFALWSKRRNRMNRYFASIGFTNINVNQKTHCEDAYGVEQQFRNYKGENRNMLTTNATARLMAEIALGRSVNQSKSKAMMELLARDPFAEKPNSQASDFVGKTLIDRKMTRANLWSKAGWTSRSRHDMAYVETPNGLKFAIAIFTEKHANDRDVIPYVTSKIIDILSKKRN